MKILAFDCALEACSVAITDNDEIVAECCEVRARGHAEVLMPMIESVRLEAAVNYRDLDLIAVTIGPGSFTGIRVGVAAARGMSIAMDKPAIGISTLAALADQAVEAVDDTTQILSIIDARRSEAYVQLFDVKRGRLLPAWKRPELDTIENIASRVNGKAGTVIGSGTAKLLELVSDRGCWTWCPAVTPSGRSVARAALSEAESSDRRPRPAPLYIRAPDTNRPRQR